MMSDANELNGAQQEIAAHRTGNGYELAGPKGRIGEITYLMVDADTWVIDHTYVDPDYRGKQLAKRLLDLLVDEARSKGKKLIPSCSYAMAEFRRHEEQYKDVWARGSGA